MSRVFLRLVSNGKIVSGWDTGVLTADRDVVGPGETFEITYLDQPPPVPVPVEGDAIDFSKAIITNQSPVEVKNWPINAKLTSLGLSATNDATINFSKIQEWPYVINMEGGEIQYTLWVGCLINNLWYFAGCITCIYRESTGNYVPTGPTLKVGQLPENWYYFAGQPLEDYQPKPGEQVAWFLTSGAQRRDDVHKITERTQIVLTPFSEGIYTW